MSPVRGCLERVGRALQLRAVPGPRQGERGVRIAAVEDVPGAVVDDDELVENQGVAQGPGGQRQAEPEKRREGDVGVGAARIPPVPEWREQHRRKRERRGARQRGQRQARAGEDGEVRRGAVGRGEQEVARREQQHDEERLALQVRRDEDERRVDRGERARRDREAAPPEDARGERGHEHGAERSRRRGRDLRGGDRIGMAERRDREEEGVAGGPEQVGVRAQRVSTGLARARGRRAGRRARRQSGRSKTRWPR